MKNFILSIFWLLFALQAQAQTAQELLKRGNAKFQEQKYMDAMADYKRAIAVDKKFAKAYHNLGNVQYLLQDYKNALQNFDKAIALAPKDAEPYQTRGAAYIALKKYPEAQKDLEKSISLNPKNSTAFFHLGEMYEALKKPVEACEAWKKARELGYLQAQERLEKKCNHAPETTPTLPASDTEKLLKSAEQKLEIRDYNGAVRDFEKVLAVDAQNARALFGRGSAEFAQGNHKLACEDWHKALKLGHKEAEHMIKDVCH